MRILQIHNRYLHRGGEDLAVDEIASVLGTRHEIRQCLFSSCDWAGKTAPSKPEQGFRMFHNPDSVELVLKNHQEWKPDLWLLHNLYPVASPGVLHLAAKLQVPTIYHLHNFRPFSVNGYCWAGDRLASEGLRKNFLPEVLAGSWQNSRLKTAIFALVLLRLHAKGWLDHVGAWIAISDFMKERFTEAGVPREKIHTIRHSWNLLNAACPPPGDDGSFLYLGRLSTEKGVPVLVETWRLLLDRLGEDCPLLHIAGEGPLQSLVEESASQNPRIKFHGLVSGEGKRQLLQNCRAVIIPSVWWEALGLVTYEAYDFAKPVLAAASGGLKETVFPGKTGFLHYPRDAGELAEHVLTLYKSPAQALQLGSEGRRWLEQNTSNARWLDAFDRVAIALLKKPPVTAQLSKTSPPPPVTAALQHNAPVIGLSLLCENPERLTGLTTVFQELIQNSLKDHPDLHWIIFLGKEHHLEVVSPRIRYVRSFPANNRTLLRLLADHLLVGPTAKKLGCRVLLTVGFVPLLCPVPCAMHVLTLHHLDKKNRSRWFRTLYRGVVLREGLRHAELVITNSQFAAEQIRSEQPRVNSKLLISPEGIDHRLFHPNPAPNEEAALVSEWNLAPGYLLWISNLYPYKQADLLLRAFARLPADLRSAHPLVFVGGDWENQRAACEALAAELQIADHIRFLGWVPDSLVPVLYRHAAAHVLASREETWGRSVTEAMACGCPCVVNDIPVMKEVARNCALVVDFSDTSQTSRALQNLLSDPLLREKLIREGIQRAGELSFERLTRERMHAILSLLHPTN